MKTAMEKDSIQVLTSLLTEAREEADRLRSRIKKYENILLSTQLLMGHEIKKPATAISGYLELAVDTAEKLSGKDRGELKTLLEKARTECELLNELNVIFIELLKANAGEQALPVQRIKVKEFFEKVVDGFPDKFDAADRVELRVSPRIESISFNSNALKLIVSNLIENALLYSTDDSKVFIEVEHAIDKRRMSNREMMKVIVKDKGIGIPRAYLRKIFSPFVRLHNNNADGSGLGLTLVRSLVELHGGEISISSERKQGTTVYLTVPIVQEHGEYMIS